MISIRQFAKEIGLSPATISLVLNSSSSAQNIPEKTQKRVRLAAKRLGYTPNPFARSLFSRRSGSVAIFLSDVTDPYCTTVLKGISSSLHSSNYLPVLLDIENSHAKFKDDLQKMVDRRIEGIIGVANTALLETELLTTVKKHKSPIVLIGRDMKGTNVSSVSIENGQGAYLAMKHLYDLGHRAIAFIKGPEDILDGAQRWKGIVKFASEAGLTIDRKLVIPMKVPGTSYEAGFIAARKLLLSKREFTALFAFDDVTAFGAIRALTEAGKNVPADCSVVGFDDVTTATFYNPPLTTIRQPMAELGSSAVGIFLELADAFFEKRETLPVHRKIEPRIVVRSSTAPLRLR
jgi:LacI family transcriptional regulator, galactose operon repressor